MASKRYYNLFTFLQNKINTVVTFNANISTSSTNFTVDLLLFSVYYTSTDFKALFNLFAKREI